MNDCRNHFQSIFSLLEHAKRLFPNKEAAIDDSRRLSYKQLYEESVAIASGLTLSGIGLNDKVIVCLPNRSEFISIFFALEAVGAVMIPCNPSCRKKEWDDIFSHITVKAVFCAQNAENIGYFFNKKQEGKLDLLVGVNFRSNYAPSLDEFMQLKCSRKVTLCAVDGHADQTTIILFTSGSTGIPKGVMLTARNLLFSAANVAEHLRCTPNDVFFVPVPFFHIFGLVPGILTSILSCGKIVTVHAFHAEEALGIIDHEKITVHYGVPTMFILEMNHPDLSKTNFQSLRTGLIAGSPCPTAIMKKIESHMHCLLIASYGATETSGGVSFTCFQDSSNHRYQSVGRVVANTKIKIVDEQQKEVPVGTIGELICSGQGVMKGYLNDVTDSLLRGEWFHTGDLAKIDERGYLYIVGRKKDMIIRGGYNIYPAELEGLYHSHPIIAEVSVVGLPDTVLGEVICAVIQLKPAYQTTEITETSLKDYLRNKVASCKIPDHIFFIDQFPLNAAGKINKAVLRERCMRELKTVLR
ncbi:MAG: class I adenylate-forming enzyme family protein [Sporolactobacillus sp.]